jgi:hypothetical protein
MTRSAKRLIRGRHPSPSCLHVGQQTWETSAVQVPTSRLTCVGRSSKWRPSWLLVDGIVRSGTISGELKRYREKGPGRTTRDGAGAGIVPPGRQAIVIPGMYEAGETVTACLFNSFTGDCPSALHAASRMSQGRKSLPLMPGCSMERGAGWCSATSGTRLESLEVMRRRRRRPRHHRSRVFRRDENLNEPLRTAFLEWTGGESGLAINESRRSGRPVQASWRADYRK